MSRFLLSLVVAACAFAPLAVAASTRVDQSVVGNGAGSIQGPLHSVVGTLGQPLIGEVTGSNLVDAGFWYLYEREASDVDDASTLAPREFSFRGPAPNPSSRFACFRLAVPRSGRVSVRLFDPGGRVVRTLVERTVDPGVLAATLDAFGLPCGIYFCRAEAEGFAQTQRLVLLH